MLDTTSDNLTLLAPALLKGDVPVPCPVIAQRAIAILKILKDGEWHTSTAIAKRVHIKPKYASDILRACKEPWGLASHTRNGWMLPQKHSVIIV